MQQMWQNINYRWHCCHWWRKPDGSMITAMTYLMIILVIAAVMAAGTINALLHDGRGPARPPRSHFEDPQFQSPAASH
jgi:hypothetical protein